MHASVLRQFRMEGRSHHSSLPYCDRIFVNAFGRDYLDARANALNLGGADEDHFQRRTIQHSLPNGTVNLTAVSIAADADVKRAQSGLLRILHLTGEQNRAGTSAECRLRAHELL